MATEGPTEYGVYWEPSSGHARGPDWENARLYFKEHDVSEWVEHFGRNPEAVARIVSDIYKAVTEEEIQKLGHPVRHPQGVAPLLQPRYSDDAFPVAFDTLRRERPEPYLALCRRVGISRRTLDHMRTGRGPLSLHWLDKIARDYGLGPEYFREYREMVVLMAVHTFMQGHPELSVGFVHRMRGLA